MRRKDREMDRDFGLMVIDKARFATLAMVTEDGKPYAIPVSPARVGDVLYIHSAREGTKLDHLRNSPEVTLVFVGDVHVPDPITPGEYQEYKAANKIGMFASTRFTTEYESAILRGRVTFVEEEEETIKGLRAISEKFTPLNMDYFEEAARSGLHRVQVLRIDILDVTAKRKKFDSAGEEMKWGRME